MTFLSLCDREDLFKELLSKFWGKLCGLLCLKEVLKLGDRSPKQTKQCPLAEKKTVKKGRFFVATYFQRAVAGNLLETIKLANVNIPPVARRQILKSMLNASGNKNWIAWNSSYIKVSKSEGSKSWQQIYVTTKKKKKTQFKEYLNLKAKAPVHKRTPSCRFTEVVN